MDGFPGKRGISIFVGAFRKHLLKEGQENVFFHLFRNHVIKHAEGLVAQRGILPVLKGFTDPLQRLIFLVGEVEGAEILLERTMGKVVLAGLVVQKA